jgi:hypothetical protein
MRTPGGGKLLLVGELLKEIFSTVRDLVTHHNRTAKPIKWAYRDPSQTVVPIFDSAVTVP